MKINFDEIINRENTNSIKWDRRKDIVGTENVIPLWVADMDFPSPKEVREAMMKRLEHPIYGYTYLNDSYYEAAVKWFHKRFGWKVDKSWICFAEGVVPGLNTIIAALTKPGDEVIIQTPVYPPFYKVIENNGCKVVENPLINNDGYYEMDLQQLEKCISNRTKLLILCSPHNPVGRVWTKEELTKLSEFCIKHDLIVVSDEIHGDIVYEPNVHTVFSTISEETAERSIICTAPNKTFNIAGFKTANIIIKNEKLRRAYNLQNEKFFIEGLNIMGAVAQEAAYTYGEEWYQELMKYLKGNIDFTLKYFKENIPEIKIQKPEGTYLLWLDCTGLGLEAEELFKFFIEQCGVWLNGGETFGVKGAGYMRMNLGTSRATLKLALERIGKGVKELQGTLN